MATIEVTVSVKITQPGRRVVEYTETSPDSATGGNPRYYIQDVERETADLAAKIAAVVKGRFGDIRDMTPQNFGGGGSVVITRSAP